MMPFEWLATTCLSIKVLTNHTREFATSTQCIPRVPLNEGESLRGAIMTSGFDFFMGQLPKSKAAGPDKIPNELLK